MTGAIFGGGFTGVVSFPMESGEVTNETTLSLFSSGESTHGFGSTAAYWMQNGDGVNYEVRATKVSGTVNTGTLNTWLTLDQTRTWTVEYGTTLRLEFRDRWTSAAVGSTADLIFLFDPEV